MSDKVRPEELWQSLSQSSRDIFSEDRIVDFLEEWADSEPFVEDLTFVVGADRSPVRPEDVFEHLASSSSYYTVDEMLEMAEKASNCSWENFPEIEETGRPLNVELGEMCVVPGEKEFSSLSESYYGKTVFEDDGKEIWLTQHEDFYQFGISPVSMEEFAEAFTSFEALTPSQCFHEAEYEDSVYNLNSDDLSYFFEFEEDLDDFSGQLYRVESNYADFVVETSKIPNDGSYELSVFCWRRTEDPIDAVDPIVRPEVVSGLKTKLMLQYYNN